VVMSRAASLLEALDLFLLAIHEIDVVAEVQVQSLDAGRGAASGGSDRTETGACVAEGSGNRGVAGARGDGEILEQDAQDREAEGCLLRSSSPKELGEGFQGSRMARFRREIFPSEGDFGGGGAEDAVDGFATGVEGVEWS